jgi:selenium metabolism protein YedF
MSSIIGLFLVFYPGFLFCLYFVLPALSPSFYNKVSQSAYVIFRGVREMKTIDARGMTCPEPVTLTKAQVDRGETELEILLDNPVAASDVRRFLENNGFAVQLKDDDGMLTISGRFRRMEKQAEQASSKSLQGKGAVSGSADAASNGDVPRRDTPENGVQPQPSSFPVPKATFSVLFTRRNLGQEDRKLGEVLMKSFLGTLSQLNNPPVTVALMNEGVKLAVYDSSSCDHLKSLERRGAVILVCGTCVHHFQIADRIGVGTISSMFEILEALNGADKIMTL